MFTRFAISQDEIGRRKGTFNSTTWTNRCPGLAKQHGAKEERWCPQYSTLRILPLNYSRKWPPRNRTGGLFHRKEIAKEPIDQMLSLRLPKKKKGKLAPHRDPKEGKVSLMHFIIILLHIQIEDSLRTSSGQFQLSVARGISIALLFLPFLVIAIAITIAFLLFIFCRCCGCCGFLLYSGTCAPSHSLTQATRVVSSHGEV